jgi:hypothetical protein
MLPDLSSTRAKSTGERLSEHPSVALGWFIAGGVFKVATKSIELPGGIG